MILINKILVSSEILENRFACNILECKGLCCCEGNAGAPLETEETGVLEEIFSKISEYLRTESLKKIKKNGLWVKNIWGGFETPLGDDGCCIYAIENDGIIQCGIEKAWMEKKINFRKPISCHLYPVRIRKFGIFEGLIYERWDICRCRNDENTPLLYEFVSDGLRRKYGDKFIERLNEIAKKKTDNFIKR